MADKGKVVWLSFPHDGIAQPELCEPNEKAINPDYWTDAIAFIPLTDHEAALAELRSWKLEVVSRLGMDDWNADSTTPTDVYRHVQWLEDRAKATLISGLEALAGDAAAYMVAVHTMISATKDGVNVHGAVSGLIGTQDNLEASLANAATLTNSAKEST